LQLLIIEVRGQVDPSTPQFIALITLPAPK
jgi:hypothetical protein